MVEDAKLLLSKKNYERFKKFAWVAIIGLIIIIGYEKYTNIKANLKTLEKNS